MEIEFHGPRLPTEPDIYEVKTSDNKGSLYFTPQEPNNVKYVDNDLHGTRKIYDDVNSYQTYLTKAAVRLIRKKGFEKVINSDDKVIAELRTNKGEEE